MSKILRASCIVSICSAMIPPLALADTDACTLVTSAQVAAAVGAPVGNGTHVTPNFVKTCTWQPSAKSSISAITVNVQTAAFYDGGKKHLAVGMAAAGDGNMAVKPASVGDDAYYYVTGDQVALFVKKGGASFKVAIYAKMPVADKEAMELKIAKDVVAKL